MGEPVVCRHNVLVTTATHAPTTPAHPTLNRPNMVSVGTVVWLSSELMFFAGLFAMYFTLRASSGDLLQQHQLHRGNERVEFREVQNCGLLECLNIFDVAGLAELVIHGRQVRLRDG